MDILTRALMQAEGGKYGFLKLYSVFLDKELGECEITFLYPEKNQIDNETRSFIQKLVEDNLKLNSKIRVKFKKSFLDERLIKKVILDFFAQNYKSILSQISEEQIGVTIEGENVLLSLSVCEQVYNLFEANFVQKKLISFLQNEFIANFSVKLIVDEKYAISSDIPFVPISVKPKKTYRYEVTIIKDLFGSKIQPFPELIKNNTSPKTSLILFGKISKVTKKEFTIKKGKRKGESKSYFSFNLYDGKTLDCIYFCPKSNENKCKALADGMNFLCLGDLRPGLDDKLTYYIKAMALAQTKVMPNEEEEVDFSQHKVVAEIEDFKDHQQENIFVKEPTYNEPIASSNIVVYDLETTGLNPELDEIIEIGAIKIEKGKITKRFASFVKPLNKISDETIKINHITNEMVANAPKIEDVIVDFYNFCEGCIISGYNNTDFDNKFLKKALAKVGLKLTNQNLDVFLLARTKKLKTNNLKLTTVAAVGIDLKGAHRAYNDAFATAKVLLKLNEAN